MRFLVDQDQSVVDVPRHSMLESISSLRGLLRIGTLADSTLIAQKFTEIRMVACCSPGYAAARRRPATPADIKRQARTGWEFLIDGVTRTFEVQGPLRANNGEVIRDGAIAGLGIALLPEFIVASALANGKLIEVFDTFVSPPLTLYAVYPQHRESSMTIRALTQFLRQRFARAIGM